MVGGGGGRGYMDLFCLFSLFCFVLSCLHAEELLPFLRIMTFFYVGMFSLVVSSESG